MELPHMYRKTEQLLEDAKVYVALAGRDAL